MNLLSVALLLSLLTPSFATWPWEEWWRGGPSVSASSAPAETAHAARPAQQPMKAAPAAQTQAQAESGAEPQQQPTNAHAHAATAEQEPERQEPVHKTAAASSAAASARPEGGGLLFPDELEKYSVAELLQLFHEGSGEGDLPLGMAFGRVQKHLPDLELYFQETEGEGRLARLEREMRSAEGEDTLASLRKKYNTTGEVDDLLPGQKLFHEALMNGLNTTNSSRTVGEGDFSDVARVLGDLGLKVVERFLQFFEEGIWTGKLFMETKCQGKPFNWYFNMWDPGHFLLPVISDKYLAQAIIAAPGYLYHGQVENENVRIDDKQSIVIRYDIKPAMCPGPTTSMKIVSLWNPFGINLVVDDVRELVTVKKGLYMGLVYLNLGKYWPLVQIYSLETPVYDDDGDGDDDDDDDKDGDDEDTKETTDR
ncbi:unnamed protein product [Vitrella brassicaformis CCMP3155]|uniref:Uncharacterized protein n=2 Tax=Vitrella brassicaformis TaxID=1169539 RepID=A0A0G4FZA4_VITBC|nr:unnamed protein product [Vitrella brassicaformis CCMP3155]|eukprot:CEM20954.1 unnamed protein product [Vitrella brassicaformis CCMP3155]